MNKYTQSKNRTFWVLKIELYIEYSFTKKKKEYQDSKV